MFRRSSGDSSDVVTKEMYEFNDRGGRTSRFVPRARPRWCAPLCSTTRCRRSRPGTRRRCSATSAPRRALPPAPPARCRDPRHRRPDGRRRGDLLAGRALRRPRPVVASPSGQLARRREVRPGLSRAAGGVPRGARGRAVRRAPLQVGREPAPDPRLQAARVPQGERGSAAAPRRLVRGLPAPLRRVLEGLDRLGIVYEQDDFLVEASTTTRARPSSSARTRSTASAGAAVTTASSRRSEVLTCPGSVSAPGSRGSCSPVTPTASCRPRDLRAQPWARRLRRRRDRRGCRPRAQP